MPTLTHVHSYIRWKIQVGRRRFDKHIQGEAVYRCSDKDCTHYVQRSALIGKTSLCPHCGTPFVLDGEALNRVIPLCLNCRGTTEGKQFRAAKDIALEILGDLE